MGIIKFHESIVIFVNSVQTSQSHLFGCVVTLYFRETGVFLNGKYLSCWNVVNIFSASNVLMAEILISCVAGLVLLT